MTSILVNLGKGGSRGTTFALVSDEDYEALSQVTWHIHTKGYVCTANKGKSGKWQAIPMHKLIMPKKEGLLIDHINRDKLDNRRENLRYVTCAQNSRNRKCHRTNKVGLRGVHQIKDRFRACIRVNGKTMNLGRFATAESAHEAFRRAALKHFGEFAGL